MIRVFIGYDSRQPVAFHVAAHSIMKRSSSPVAITPLRLEATKLARRGLTEFTYSRFLTPFLSDYKGYSVFLDSDTLCLSDIDELVATAMLSEIWGGVPTPVFVSKNKLRFEWPSVMVFNNELCQKLTPQYIEDTKNSLFDFAWADRVGELPGEWNHLVGYDELNPKAKLIHFTQGIPIWPETAESEFAAEWKAEFKSMVSSVSFAALMGQSVHAKPVYDQYTPNLCTSVTAVS